MQAERLGGREKGLRPGAGQPGAELAKLKPPLSSTLKIHLDPKGLVVLAGTITDKAPDRNIGAFLRSVHDAALRDQMPELRVNVCGLSFVNSSGIRLFIDWVSWLNQQAQPKYKLCFVRNPSVTWQRVSFSAIQNLAGSELSIEDGT